MTIFTGVGILNIKLKQSWNHAIFIMEIDVPVRQNL